MSEKHKLFMQNALLFATQSTCCRKQVGAVIVKEGRIVSTGYNGTVAGACHCKDRPEFRNIDWTTVKHGDPIAVQHHEWSLDNELHAETNAIAFAAKNGVDTNGCDCYTTLAPCNNCAKLMAAAGIKNVYYLERYDRGNPGLTFLADVGIHTEMVTL